jgi:hypothetical protein
VISINDPYHWAFIFLGVPTGYQLYLTVSGYDSSSGSQVPASDNASGFQCQ